MVLLPRFYLDRGWKPLLRVARPGITPLGGPAVKVRGVLFGAGQRLAWPAQIEGRAAKFCGFGDRDGATVQRRDAGDDG